METWVLSSDLCERAPRSVRFLSRTSVKGPEGDLRAYLGPLREGWAPRRLGRLSRISVKGPQGLGPLHLCERAQGDLGAYLGSLEKGTRETSYFPDLSGKVAMEMWVLI